MLLMGVINTTPDSFSDGGLYLDPAAAKHRVDELLGAGADIIDIGGESTRPGAPAVPDDQQIARIRHALVYAAQERRALVSVDTTRPAVAVVLAIVCIGAGLVLLRAQSSASRPSRS